MQHVISHSCTRTRSALSLVQNVAWVFLDCIWHLRACASCCRPPPIYFSVFEFQSGAAFTSSKCCQTLLSLGYRPVSARLLKPRPLVGSCVWLRGRLLQQHPLGQSSTHVEGYNSPKVAAQTIVYATAHYCQVKGKRARQWINMHGSLTVTELCSLLIFLEQI